MTPVSIQYKVHCERLPLSTSQEVLLFGVVYKIRILLDKFEASVISAKLDLEMLESINIFSVLSSFENGRIITNLEIASVLTIQIFSMRVKFLVVHSFKMLFIVQAALRS